MSSGDIQCHALQRITLFCNRFTEGCPPDLWINAADFAHQKIVMKLVHLTSEKTFHELDASSTISVTSTPRAVAIFTAVNAEQVRDS